MKQIQSALLALTLSLLTCARNAPVWPGGDEPTQTISATEVMWEFFASHPKP